MICSSLRPLGRAHQRTAASNQNPEHKRLAFALSLTSQPYLTSTYAIFKWISVLAFEFPNREIFLGRMRWRAYLRVSDRRSNCRIPFVLFQPTTRVRNCMLLLCPAAVKIHLGATRAVQHVLGSDHSTRSSAHEAMRNCTLDLLKLGNLICLCPGLSVSMFFVLLSNTVPTITTTAPFRHGVNSVLT